QFLDLIDLRDNPFVTAPTTANLPANYRSHEEIIKFNNDFFTCTGTFLENSTYHKLFLEGNQQNYNHKKGGLVQLGFIEVEGSQKEDDLYCEAVLTILEQVLEKKYTLKDICILTRKKRHGILLADFLMQHNIPIISSETLLLNGNPKVRFLIDLLYLSVRPADLEIGLGIISFLFKDEKSLHQYIKDYLKTVPDLLREHYRFGLETLKQASVYDGLEYAIKIFGLAEDSDAYVTYLLDVVLEVEQKEGSNSQVFLAYWEKKKNQLSIAAPENVDAVQIMTVHKSKGLEFPIVIFPFANTHIYEEIDAKLWLPVPEESFNGFQEILINKKQEVLTYGEVAETIYQEEQHKLELDAFNILYVALTRAVKGLYIVTKKDLTLKGEHRPSYYSGLFIHYLKEKGLWEDATVQYQFGSLENNMEALDAKSTRETIPFPYTFKERAEFRILTKSGALWDTNRENAIYKGNLVHFIMGTITSREDRNDALNGSVRQGDLTMEELTDIKNKINAIVDHPELYPYFDQGIEVRNEQEILTKDGKLLRPDRIVIKGDRATIIDYKTGRKNPAYHQQIQLYADMLEEMGYQIENKILVYIDEGITLDFI
ncbi:MAG TPA: 3'-5' exonuclease, partial [Arenibacter sp.]|nr:3'-5' exonuclease [Arenibacter sp.]